MKLALLASGFRRLREIELISSSAAATAAAIHGLPASPRAYKLPVSTRGVLPSTAAADREQSMAASLGLLGHEACYAAAPYPPPAASSCCFFPPELVAGSGAAMDQFPPAAAMDDYFLPEIMGARATDYYSSPATAPPPVFSSCGGAAAENEIMVNVSYTDGDGRRMVMTSGSGGSNGGGRPSPRIGFRTRTEVDVLDDGFKWRKYGKKAVKSSPNPRNYYRCSAEGCGVKKRVERDGDDPRYVVTTYDGVHNHAAPGSGGACLAPPRGAQTQGVPPRPACSAPLVAAPWSAPGGAPCDAWGVHAATAAHSSESSY